MARDAWVEWEDFITRANAHLEDVDDAFKNKLLSATELAMLGGDAALLVLSGAGIPHQRAGQLDTLVIDGNPGGVKCIYPMVGTRPVHPPCTQGAPTCTPVRGTEGKRE